MGGSEVSPDGCGQGRLVGEKSVLTDGDSSKDKFENHDTAHQPQRQRRLDQHLCLLLYYFLLDDSVRNTIRFIKPFIVQQQVTLILSGCS